MKSASTWAALAVVLYACGGCASLRRPSPPPMPLPSSYTASSDRQLADAPVEERWWVAFGSPQLEAIVGEAIAGSLTLESAKQKLLAQQELLAAARAAYFPSVTADANVTREKQSAAAFGLPPNALPLPNHFDLFQVGANAAYRLDVFGRTRSRVEEQQALVDVQGFQVGAAYLMLTGNSVLEAVQLAAANAQLAALRAILDIDTQTVESVRKARDLGAVGDADLIRAQNQLAVDQALQPGIDQQVSLSSHALAVLVGKAPAQWSPPVLDLDSIRLPAEQTVSMPSRLARERPDILAAEARLRVAAAQVGIATAELFPDITLSAGVGTTGLNVGDLFSPAGLVWSVAAGLSQPIFDAGMRLAQRRAALAQFKGSAADYQQTVLEAFAQVADILEALNHDAALETAQKRALDTAAQAVKLERISYQGGAAGILELLDAQRQNQQAMLGYVRARAQRLSDTVELYVALGGGWCGTHGPEAQAPPALTQLCPAAAQPKSGQ